MGIMIGLGLFLLANKALDIATDHYINTLFRKEAEEEQAQESVNMSKYDCSSLSPSYSFSLLYTLYALFCADLDRYMKEQMDYVQLDTIYKSLEDVIVYDEEKNELLGGLDTEENVDTEQTKEDTEEETEKINLQQYLKTYEIVTPNPPFYYVNIETKKKEETKVVEREINKLTLKTKDLEKPRFVYPAPPRPSPFSKGFQEEKVKEEEKVNEEEKQEEKETISMEYEYDYDSEVSLQPKRVEEEKPMMEEKEAEPETKLENIPKKRFKFLSYFKKKINT